MSCAAGCPSGLSPGSVDDGSSIPYSVLCRWMVFPSVNTVKIAARHNHFEYMAEVNYTHFGHLGRIGLLDSKKPNAYFMAHSSC